MIHDFKTTTSSPDETGRLAKLDREHVWHPFTPMQKWREEEPLIIERGEGDFLIDVQGRRYIDGVSSLWCNVHGHKVRQIDEAIRDQLERIAHSTLLGLASPASIELAARLCELTPSSLNKVFYSDAGATAVEVALKMAVGYWHHVGRPKKNCFIALQGAYHGDTIGAMSVGFSDLFHRPFSSMVFPVRFVPAPDACRALRGSDTIEQGVWPSEDQSLAAVLRDQCLEELGKLLADHGTETAAVIIEPVMQGAAGMICQPPNFVRGVAELAKRHDVLLIADEVATGFGRTGSMFACDHEIGRDFAGPDIMCLGKGITGGYLPLAATIVADRIEQAFCGEIGEQKTLFHGHTYTGNALGCAAAMASLDLFEANDLLDHIRQSAQIVSHRLNELRDCPHVLDVRHRGIMAGIELCRDRSTLTPLDAADRTGTQACMAMRAKGLILRPLGDVIVLMPICAMAHDTLHRMLDVVIETIQNWQVR